MDILQDHQTRFKLLELSVDRWSRHYANAHDELRQWQYHIEMQSWFRQVLIQSLFKGDQGVEDCILDLEQDPIPGRQGMKFLYCYQIWGTLPANPNEVAMDLIGQGWTPTTLGNVIVNKYLAPVLNAETMDIPTTFCAPTLH